MKILSGTGRTMRIIIVIFLCMEGLILSFAGQAAAGDAGKGGTDFPCLEGRWVRPDGGYVLELRDIRKDGSVAAAYFNPRQIRVYRARVSKKDGRTSLFVELRDINYPGSTYRLVYDPAADRLRGAYYQAVHMQTYQVEFARAR
jgi:hypothetical protein